MTVANQRKRDRFGIKDCVQSNFMDKIIGAVLRFNVSAGDPPGGAHLRCISCTVMTKESF
jgi:hypothetical protein